LQVEWEEANNRFPGVVKSVNEDGSCDVLYYEQVGGKPCLERNVQSHRIEISQSPGSSGRGGDKDDEDYWEESDKSPTRKRGMKDQTDGGEGHAGRRHNHGSVPDTFVHRLLQVREFRFHSLSDTLVLINKFLQAVNDGKNLADDASAHELCNVDIRTVHDALTPQLGAHFLHPLRA
jgi:hypothetical protein